MLLVICQGAVLASEEIELQSANFDPEDRGAVLRGAKHFVTYCLGCHSIKHIRYQRIAKDFGLNDKKVLDEIAPKGANIYEQMHTAMNPHDSEKWFGVQPPDLSLVSRSRSADWLYSYLKSFYNDPKKPLGTNNLIFKDVGMPNVFWQIQGEQKPVYEEDDGEKAIVGLEPLKAGKLTEEEFDTMVNELVNFLVYVGEPVKLERERLGKYVLFYLAMFLLVAYLLKKEYWKDIH
jgi:ubiquinol-cytochrome c reductase cytochrome c1 subunit